MSVDTDPIRVLIQKVAEIKCILKAKERMKTDLLFWSRMQGAGLREHIIKTSQTKRLHLQADLRKVYQRIEKRNRLLKKWRQFIVDHEPQVLNLGQIPQPQASPIATFKVSTYRNPLMK